MLPPHMSCKSQCPETNVPVHRTETTRMNSHNKRRLTATVVALALIAAPSIWIGRQYHQQALNIALIAAVKRSDAAAVDSLLASGANPNSRDTPTTHESVFQVLMQVLHPPAPNTSPTALDTALLLREPDLTISHQTLAIVKLLLRKGADSNIRDTVGDTAVTELFYCNESVDTARVLETLLSAGGSTELKGASDMTPLATAIQFYHASSVAVLLEHRARVESDNPVCTPLMAACTYGQTSAVLALLDHGADANPRPVQNETPLSMARMQGYSNIIKLLVAHGADK